MEIAPGVYGVDFEGRVWAYLYRDGAGFTLIDAGIAGKLHLLEAALKSLGSGLRDVKQIVLTHCHKDHTGTVAELQGVTSAPTLAHAFDAPVIRGEAKAAEPRLSGPERQLYEHLAGNMPDAPPARIARELQDGDTIEMGDTARVVHAPGHTDGSIAVYVPSRRLLFTGDAAASVGGRPIVGVFNVDPSRAHESFVRLGELDCETACFGHGTPITSGASSAIRRAVESL